MKMIGDRISIKPSSDITTIVITTKIASWKEALLAGWIVCWLICLGVFLSEMFKPHTDREYIVLFVIVVFMFYYAVRVIKVFAWRKWGMEYIKVSNDAFTYKRAIRGIGKAHIYYLDNIEEIGIVRREDGSLVKLLENSFWVRGGERIAFDYLGRSVRFGMQLEYEHAEKLGKWLDDHLKKRKKKAVNAGEV